jgi:hypothetical protein
MQHVYFCWIIGTIVIFTLGFVLVEQSGMGDRQMRVWALVSTVWPFALLAMLIATLWHGLNTYRGRASLAAPAHEVRRGRSRPREIAGITSR